MMEGLDSYEGGRRGDGTSALKTYVVSSPPPVAIIMESVGWFAMQNTESECRSKCATESFCNCIPCS